MAVFEIIPSKSASLHHLIITVTDDAQTHGICSQRIDLPRLSGLGTRGVKMAAIFPSEATMS